MIEGDFRSYGQRVRIAGEVRQRFGRELALCDGIERLA